MGFEGAGPNVSGPEVSFSPLTGKKCRFQRILAGQEVAEPSGSPALSACSSSWQQAGCRIREGSGRHLNVLLQVSREDLRLEVLNLLLLNSQCKCFSHGFETTSLSLEWIDRLSNFLVSSPCKHCELRPDPLRWKFLIYNAGWRGLSICKGKSQALNRQGWGKVFLEPTETPGDRGYLQVSQDPL